MGAAQLSGFFVAVYGVRSGGIRPAGGPEQR